VLTVLLHDLPAFGIIEIGLHLLFCFCSFHGQSLWGWILEVGLGSEEK
jgi:hypothetical protein